MNQHAIYDSGNNRTTATVGGDVTGTLSALPLGKTGGGEVYLKTGAISLATIADGADVAQGTTTDAPVADNTTAASATAATGISLWKRLVNLGIAILAKQPGLGTAGTANANVLSVQGIANATPLNVAPPTAGVTASGALVSTSGSVASGARYVDMLFSSDFDGTVLGVAVLGSALSGYSFPPIAEHTYGAIAYTRAAGSITIFKGI